MCKLDGDEEAKRKVCEIALKAKPVYLKTSTGRSFKGADLNDVKLMKSILKDAVVAYIIMKRRRHLLMQGHQLLEQVLVLPL